MNNGNVKWWQLVTAFISLLGIVVTITIWGATQVIAIDIRSTDRDTSLTNCLHTYIIPMREDIARIKDKLEIK